MLHFFVPSGMATDDPTAFAPPPSFGPFRVLHQIGIGALGPVFRTYEPTRDRLVAVKVFRLDITPEQAQVLARSRPRIRCGPFSIRRSSSDRRGWTERGFGRSITSPPIARCRHAPYSPAPSKRPGF